MTAKKPTIAAKPTRRTAEEFIGGAMQQVSSDPSHGKAPKPPKEKKIQVPLLIPPSLLEELDGSISRLGTGASRSAWICQAIREKLSPEER